MSFRAGAVYRCPSTSAATSPIPSLGIGVIASAWAPGMAKPDLAESAGASNDSPPGVGDEVRGHDGGGNGDEDTHGFREANARKER